MNWVIKQIGFLNYISLILTKNLILTLKIEHPPEMTGHHLYGHYQLLYPNKFPLKTSLSSYMVVLCLEYSPKRICLIVSPYLWGYVYIVGIVTTWVLRIIHPHFSLQLTHLTSLLYLINYRHEILALFPSFLFFVDSLSKKTDFFLLFFSFSVPFVIDPGTGVVNVSRPLDISESEQYDLTAEVFDGVWRGTASIH